MANNRALLSQLEQADIISADTAQQLAQSGTPWWLQLLLGFTAWIASILIISSFIGPVLALADNNAVRMLAAAMLLATAMWLATQTQEFLQHMSVAIALAGQGLLVYALYDLFGQQDDVPRYASALISGLLLFSPLNQLHQRVSLSIAAACLLSLLSSAAALAAARPAGPACPPSARR